MCRNKSEVETSKMAEGWTHNVRCRYYANGICREGEACRYLHQGEAGSSLSTYVRIDASETLCRYYQRGACAYGPRCRFVHAGEVSTSSTNNASHNTSLASSSTTRKSSVTHVHKTGRGTSQKTSVLKKQGDSSDSGIGEDSAENWVNAPEFVPSGKNNIPKTAEHAIFVHKMCQQFSVDLNQDYCQASGGT